MKKNRDTDTMSKATAWAVLIFGILVAVWSQVTAADWDVPVRFPLADSASFLYYRNNTLLASSTTKRLNTTTFDTTFTVNSLGTYVAGFKLWRDANDSPTIFIDQRVANPKLTTFWRTPAYWEFATDSVKLITILNNGTPVTFTKRSGTPQSYDTAFTVSGGNYYHSIYKIWADADTTPMTWIFELDLVDTASTSGDSCCVTLTTDSALLCQVTGRLLRRDFSRVVGASIQAVRTAGDAATGSLSGSTVIYTGEPVTAVTDTNGSFSMYLVRSSMISQVAGSYYNVTGYYGGQKVFERLKLTIPPTGNLSIGDSLKL